MSRPFTFDSVVCILYLVKVNLDRADVGGTDGCEREETVLPLARQDDALIEDKEVLQQIDKVRRDRKQFASKVSSGLNDPVRGRVETMVVARGKIDNAKEKRMTWPDMVLLMHACHVVARLREGLAIFRFGIVRQTIRPHRARDLLATAQELIQRVMDSIHVGKLFFVDNIVHNGELSLGWRG